MSNQSTPITDDEIRSVLYRMAAHVSFFAEPRTLDPKAAAFADALMSAVRPPEPAPVSLKPDQIITSSNFLLISLCVRELSSMIDSKKPDLRRCRVLTDRLSKVVSAPLDNSYLLPSYPLPTQP